MGGGMGRRRILIVGAAVLALLAAVGLASRAHTPVGGGGQGRALDTDILLEYALLLTLAAAVIVLPVAAYLFITGRDNREIALPARRNWMVGLFFAMTAFAVASALVLHHGFLKRDHLNPKGVVAKSPFNPGGSGHPTRAVRFDWLPVIVVSSLLAAGLTAAAVVFVRRREPARPRRVVDALVLAVEQTLEDLRAEPDPRRAVIAAYAQMEGALGRAGLPRRPSEAPREYLHRVLPAVGAGAVSVERLTALFERAKFSPHAIDGAMKEEAIVALEALRDELRGAS